MALFAMGRITGCGDAIIPGGRARLWRHGCGNQQGSLVCALVFRQAATLLNIKAIGQRLGLEVLNGLARASLGAPATLQHGSHTRHAVDYWGEPESDRPLVIFFYGGGWTSGARRDYRFVADTFRRLGCDVAVPDYRLYPEVRFDEISKDAIAAVHYVLAHVAGDRPIVLAGHSAGAQIAIRALDRATGAAVIAIDRAAHAAGDHYPVPGLVILVMALIDRDHRSATASATQITVRNASPVRGDNAVVLTEIER